jgi:hypothetical protein
VVVVVDHDELRISNNNTEVDKDHVDNLTKNEQISSIGDRKVEKCSTILTYLKYFH